MPAASISRARLLNFGNMRVANWAIDEAPELQMDEVLRIGEAYGIAGHSYHHLRRQGVA